MAARKSSRVIRKYKTKYRVRNWRKYERGLRSRGDVTIWLSQEAIAAWTPPQNGRRGGQRRYSQLAILTALTLRLVFRLPLRQTEGFLESLLSLMGLDLQAPDLSLAKIQSGPRATGGGCQPALSTWISEPQRFDPPDVPGVRLLVGWDRSVGATQAAARQP